MFIFIAVIDSLLEAKQIHGSISGRQAATSTYVPYIYTKAQNEWADNFYRQNGYLGKSFHVFSSVNIFVVL